MAKLKIDTDAVVTTADKIKLLNTQMRDEFESVRTAITKLDRTWDGAAATVAISKFNEIQSTMGDARYDVMDQYVNFLLQQVGEGYVQTETTNISLADQFK